MKVKRFFAPDMHNAMRLVRDEVGPDAVIISNNRVAGGVEVVVALEYDAEPKNLQAPDRRQRKEQQHNVLAGKREPSRSLRNALGRTQSYLAQEQSRSRSEEPPLLRAVKDRQLSLDDKSLDQVLAALEKRDGLRGRESKQRVPAGEPRRSAERARPAESSARKPGAAEFQALLGAQERLGGQERRDGSSAGAPTGRASPEPEAESAALSAMREEIESLKRLLGRQMQAGTPAPPADPSLRGELERRLQRLGLAEGVRRQLLQGVESDQPLADAWKHVLARLADALPTVGEDLIERGGLIAFIGPTGVGKTTTIGKLAAKYVLKHGSSSIALVTTDSYRIAAHEQLRTFGRILDIPVRVVDENRSLDEALHSLRDKRLVLIDTAGMGGGSPQTGEQVAMLENCSSRLKKVLVLSCASQYQVLKSSYDQFQALGLNGCVFSKLDETASLGEALSVVVEGRLPVAYVTDGQRIPDNLELAQARALVSRCVVMAQEQLGRRSIEVATDQAGWEADIAPASETGWAS